MAEEDLARMITEVKDSLERELHSLERAMREGFEGVNARFDAQAARLDRHAALWQTGRCWSARMDDWAAKVDAALEAGSREIAELRSRLEKLEGRNGR